MARFFLHGVILKNIFIAAACVLASACAESPVALAQRVGHPAAGTHFSGAGRVVTPHVVAPPIFHAPLLRPQTGFRQGPVPFLHHPVFIRPPSFRVRQNFYSLWWLNCGPLWGWQFGCGDFFLYAYPIENPVTPLIYENPPSPVYLYSGYAGGELALVQLFLKDGTVFSVTDYWFVNDQVHFKMVDEDGTKSEQAIAVDELDLKKTINVNTRRGFRFVKRDEPMEQYLRDHPNLDPPLVQPPQQN